MTHPYAQFSESKNGAIQHRMIWNALFPLLETLPQESKVLDAGCGDGWLAAKLTDKFRSVMGNDVSSELIEAGRKKYPSLELSVHDLSNSLPFPPQSFDAVILNMVLHNIQEQKAAIKNISAVTKKGGHLFMVMPNPYYMFPVGVWKTSLLDKIFGRLPKLTVEPYAKYAQGEREFSWVNKPGMPAVPARFSTLPEQVTNILEAGFALEKIQEILGGEPTTEFDLDYKVAQFPMFLVLTFKKLW